MPRKQQRSMKENTEGTQRMLEDRKKKKGHFRERNYQKDSQQENYLDGWIRGMTKNTGQGWKETGEDGKGKGKEDKEQWR